MKTILTQRPQAEDDDIDVAAIASRYETWAGKPWESAHGWYPFTAAFLLACVIAPVRMYHLPWWASTGLGLLLLVCATASVWGKRFIGSFQLCMMAGGAVATGWLAYINWDASVRPGTPLIATCVIWLVAMLGFSVWWSLARDAQISWEAERKGRDLAAARRIREAQEKRRQQEQEQQVPAAPIPPRDPEAIQWEAMFARWGHKNLTFVARVPDERGNIAIHMKLPDDGSVTFDDLSETPRKIEIVLSRKGDKPITAGSVSLEQRRLPGVDGQVLISPNLFTIHINVVNILAKTIWWECDHRPTTIEKAIQLGFYQDGTPLYMTIPEIHWFFGAQSGNGKSNLVDILIMAVSKCEDASIVLIDMKQGNVAKDHLRAKLDEAINPDTKEPVSRPPFAWVATNRYEAERVFRGFQELSHARGAARTTGNRHKPSKKSPHYFILIDEHSQLVGQHVGPSNSYMGEGWSYTDFAAVETDMVSRSRSEGITFCKFTQRGTNDMSGSGSAGENYKGRGCLGASDYTEAGYVLNNKTLARLAASITTKGTLAIECGGMGDRDMLGKVFFVGDDDDRARRLYDCARRHGDITPGVPPGTLDWEVLSKYGLADAWTDPDRIGWIHGQHITGVPWKQTGGQIAEGRGEGRELPQSVAAELAEVERLRAQYAAEDQAAAAEAQTAAPQPVPSTVFVDGVAMDPWLAEFGRDLETEDPTVDATPAAAPAEQSKEDRVYAIIASHGASGRTWSDLAEDLVSAGILTPEGKSATSRLIKKLMAQGRIRQPHGPKTKYYAADALPKAA